MNPSGKGEAPRGWVRYQYQQRRKPARHQPKGPLHPHPRFDVRPPPAALNKGVDSLSPAAQQQRCCWLMPVPKSPTHLGTGADPSKGSPMHWLWQCHPLPPPTAQPTLGNRLWREPWAFPSPSTTHRRWGSRAAGNRPCYANTHTRICMYMCVSVHCIEV